MIILVTVLFPGCIQMEAAADDVDDDFDAETASIHSRASDFILDDDEDLFVRNQDAALEVPLFILS